MSSNLAATVNERLVRGELARCATCGRVQARSEMYREWAHIGGQDDRLEYYCQSGHLAH